jgi:ATP-dependent RNA helicase DDX1
MLNRFQNFAYNFSFRHYDVVRRLIDAHCMDQCLIFCRTNFDCDNLEMFLNAVGGGGGGGGGGSGGGGGGGSGAGGAGGAGGGGGGGKIESGKYSAYSCAVLGASRSQDERRRALQAFKVRRCRLTRCNPC